MGGSTAIVVFIPANLKYAGIVATCQSLVEPTTAAILVNQHRYC